MFDGLVPILVALKAEVTKVFAHILLEGWYECGCKRTGCLYCCCIGIYCLVSGIYL